MDTRILPPTKENIELCACALQEGSLVAFPTETVYGLGGNALDPTAAKRIYEVKGRPSDNPLIVHVAAKEKIEAVGEVTAAAQRIIEALMPGPVTVVLKKLTSIPYEVTGGLETVAVRIPAHDAAIKLLKAAAVPIAAPSANTSTRPSPTAALHVYDDLGGKIPYILDGGSCEIGIESTIIDCSGDIPALLRRGGVPAEILEDLLRIPLKEKSGDRPLCPGMKYKHYSPLAAVYLFDDDDLAAVKAEKEGAAVFTYGKLTPRYRYAVDMGPDDASYARRLFDRFRQCDKQGFSVIYCKIPRLEGIGLSLYNRLFKAAAGKKLEVPNE